MSDCISRQSAIFLANDLKQDLPDDERIGDMVMARNEGILEYQTQLSLLPSVNPQEPKTGHWIKGNMDEGIYCSECKTKALTDDFWFIKSNYCPNCGARMEGE